MLLQASFEANRTDIILEQPKDLLSSIVIDFFVNPFEQDKDDSDEEEDDSDRPYLFFINGQEIKTDIVACLKQVLVDTEKTVPIVYQPQAVFR